MLKKCIQNLFLYMSKGEAKKLMNNSNLIDKKGILSKKNYLFFHYIKKWIKQLIIKETEKKY